MLIVFAIQVILFAIFGIAVASLVVILAVKKAEIKSIQVTKVSDEVGFLNWLGIE